MPTVTRTDPLRNFKFRVQIQPIAGDGPLATMAEKLPNMGFAQMSGIAVTNEVIPYREGGMNTHPHKMVGQSDFAPVSLARGVFASASGESLYNWQQFLHAWQGGVPNGSTGGGDSGRESDYRCEVTISVYDHPVTATGFNYATDPDVNVTDSPIPTRLQVKLYNAWPGSYSISDLNAGDNGILIQQMQLHHEGFKMDWDVANNA